MAAYIAVAVFGVPADHGPADDDVQDEVIVRCWRPGCGAASSGFPRASGA